MNARTKFLTFVLMLVGLAAIGARFEELIVTDTIQLRNLILREGAAIVDASGNTILGPDGFLDGTTVAADYLDGGTVAAASLSVSGATTLDGGVSVTDTDAEFVGGAANTEVVIQSIDPTTAGSATLTLKRTDVAPAVGFIKVDTAANGAKMLIAHTGGNGIQFTGGGPYQFVGIPEYATKIDADTALDAGSLYTLPIGTDPAKLLRVAE